MWKRKVKSVAAWVLIIIMIFSNVVYAGEWSRNGLNWNYTQDGVKQTGWIEDGTGWYYLDQNGNMRTGWFQEGNVWYFLNTIHDGYYGRAVAGQWSWIDGYCYLFDAAGKMYADCVTPDGYQVNADGRWMKDGVVQFEAGKGIITAVKTNNDDDDDDDDDDRYYVKPEVPVEPVDPIDPVDPDLTKVTREEWIVTLAELTRLGSSNDGQYSYDDYLETERPALVEAALWAGFIPLEADEDNMLYFRPDDYATREFVAYTAIHALSYQMAEEWVVQVGRMKGS